MLSIIITAKPRRNFRVTLLAKVVIIAVIAGLSK